MGIQQQRAKENQRDIGRESFMILRESMTVRDDSLGLLPRKDSLAVHNKWQIFRKSYLVLNYLPSADFGVSKFRTIEVGDSNWSLLVFIENIDKKVLSQIKKI